MKTMLYLVVSFLASIVGAICGIGGGVIIKPVLDLCGLASVSTISFLSGCTVLSMSCYSVAKNLTSGESRVDMKTGTPLAIGGAVGGILGKQMFSAVKAMFANPNTVGAVQAVCLALLTVGTLGSLDLAAMHLGNGPAQIQTDTRTLHAHIVGITALVEAVEYM